MIRIIFLLAIFLHLPVYAGDFFVPDSNFDSSTNPESFFSDSNLLVQADGKLLIIDLVNSGFVDSCSISCPYTFRQGQLRVRRFNLDGMLDNNYATAGEYIHQGRLLIKEESSLAAETFHFQVDSKLQSSGKLLLSARTFAAGDYNNNNTQVFRLNTDGSLDTGFASSGFIDLAAGNPAASIHVLADDSFLLIQKFPASSLQVLKYSADGQLDNSFGALSNWPGSYITTAARQLGNGKILIAGYTNDSYPGNNIFIAQLNSDGSFDSSFATNGISTFSSATLEPHAIELFNDDSILLIGQDIAKISAGGILDTSFQNNTADFSLENGFSNNKMVFIDSIDNSILTIDIWGVISKRLSDGSKDLNFAFSGEQKIHNDYQFTNSTFFGNTLFITNHALGTKQKFDLSNLATPQTKTANSINLGGLEDTPVIGSFNMIGGDGSGNYLASVNSAPVNGTISNLVSKAYGEISFTYTPTTEDFNGLDSFVISVTDIANNNALVTVNITLDPVHDAPVFSISGNQATYFNDELFSISPVIEKAGDNPSGITWSTQDMPGWLAIDNNTGVISGNLAGNTQAKDSFFFWLVASDGIDSSRQSVRIIVGNRKPTISMNTAYQLNRGEQLQIQPLISDPDGDPVTVLTSTNLPGWIKVDSTSGEITGNTCQAQGGPLYSNITIYPDDPHGGPEVVNKATFSVEIIGDGGCKRSSGGGTFPLGFFVLLLTCVFSRIAGKTQH